jgi:hypothetical protein
MLRRIRTLPATPVNFAASLLAGILLTACGFDPTDEKYDRVRYDELRKTDCREMASLGAKRFIAGKSGETYESILARCEKMKALSFDEYRTGSKQARETGKWPFEAPPSATEQPTISSLNN